MKCLIIGSGIAGLTAGAYLARAGHNVTVYEQFPTPGGVTATVRKDGFGWDIGPLLLDGFLPGDPGRQILEELGVSERVTALHEDRGLVMKEFSLRKPASYQGPRWRLQRLIELFPEEKQGLTAYYRFYDQVMRLFTCARRLEYTTGLSALYWKLRLLLAFLPLRDKKDWNGQQVMDHYFKSAAIKTFFLGIVADFVTAPSEFPGLGVPTIHLETAFDKRIPRQPGLRGAEVGYSYIQNGCQSLVDAVMGALTASGGQVLTGREVKKILIEEGKAVGVELADGTRESAEVILASGAAREVFHDLVGKEHLPEDWNDIIEQNRLMESVLMVQLGIDFDPAPYMPASLCYYYHTTDLEAAVKRLRSGDYHEGKDGFLIYVPSHHSPSLAPEGKWAVTIYTVAPDTLARGSWQTDGERLADLLVAEAEAYVPGLRQHTLTRLVLTPEDFRKRTHMRHHSFGGMPPVMSNRPLKHKTPIENLWFIGSQSENGGGVVHVMTGARKTVRQILGEGRF